MAKFASSRWQSLLPKIRGGDGDITTNAKGAKISTAPSHRKKSPCCMQGLSLPAWDDHFDLYFEVKSDFLGSALAGEARGEAGERCAKIPAFRKSPPHWGLKVDTLNTLWSYMQLDAEGYASAHYEDEDHQHICVVTPCEWHHHGTNIVPEGQAVGMTRPMNVNMHLINGRYIKPWTQSIKNAEAGLALVMNTARLCDRPGPSAEAICKASIFISHCWDELSTAFFGTLLRNFTPERVVWVCSFALDQNSNVGDALKQVETIPFYLALQSSLSVTAITDATCVVFDRVWCVLEAHLALSMDKNFSIFLWEDEDPHVWQVAAEKLSKIDVHECKATRQDDKKFILKYCDKHLDAVNRHLHEISVGAVHQAEIRSLAKRGHLEELYKRMTIDELRQWATGKRQRCLTHLFALHSHVHQLAEFSEKIDHVQLDNEDIDCRTPLSLACEVGEVATVECLVTLRASVNAASDHDMSPMHFAAANGHHVVIRILQQHGADIEKTCTFKGEVGHKPMSIAISKDNDSLVRDFLGWRCDCNFVVEGYPVIHFASKWGFTRVVTALVAGRADVNARSSEGQTALMHAAVNGHASVVAVLRCAGADMTLVDNEGLGVVDCVEECRKDQPFEADDIRHFLSSLPNPSKVSPSSADGVACGIASTSFTLPSVALASDREVDIRLWNQRIICKSVDIVPLRLGLLRNKRGILLEYSVPAHGLDKLLRNIEFAAVLLQGERSPEKWAEAVVAASRETHGPWLRQVSDEQLQLLAVRLHQSLRANCQARRQADTGK